MIYYYLRIIMCLCRVCMILDKTLKACNLNFNHHPKLTDIRILPAC